MCAQCTLNHPKNTSKKIQDKSREKYKLEKSLTSDSDQQFLFPARITEPGKNRRLNILRKKRNGVFKSLTWITDKESRIIRELKLGLPSLPK